jgi:hypothetical protein
MTLERATAIPDRLVRVLVGPSGAPGREFKGPLRIVFKLDQTNGSKPNKAEIQIYNLSLNTINFIERSGKTLQLFVGEGAAGRVFAGDVASRGVMTRIDVPNRVTTIRCADGRRKWREQRFVRAYSPGITRLQVLRDVIAATGLPLGFQSAQLRDLNFATGWSFGGKARDALTQLLKIDNSRYSIQDGILQILAADEVEPGNAPLITPGTGLKQSPTRTDKGVSFQSVLNLSVKPGRAFRIESIAVTGDFKCTKATHSGDSRGIEWNTAGQGLPLRKAS